MMPHDSDSNIVHKNNRRATSVKSGIKLACLSFCFTGVAEQFALAEASMNVWSLNDSLEQPSTSLQGLITCLQFLFYCTAKFADPLCLNTRKKIKTMR